MCRKFLLIIVFLLTTLGGACQGPTAVVPPSITTATATAVTAPPTTLSSHTPTTAPTVTATAVASATVTPIPRDLSLQAGKVYVYPYPVVYEGDKVTFQIVAHVPPVITPQDIDIELQINGVTIAHEGTFSRHALGGQTQAIIEWIWDTTEQVGSHQVQIILDPDDTIQIGDENPDNNQTAFSFTVNSNRQGTSQHVNTIWKTANLPCCNVHVVSGTAADRDLPALLTAVDNAVQQAIRALDESPQQPLEIYLVERVIGQGGYAGGEVVLSYLDRNYAGFNFHEVMAHEAVHVLDRQFAPRRISFLAEGVAVWGAGGHYKPEDLPMRTAALHQIGRYIPLADLADEFYTITQHEAGYLQAAGFVSYLVDTYGWLRFRDFYSDVVQSNDHSPSQILDEMLRTHYNETLADIEADWLAYLADIDVSETAVADLQTSLTFYNVMRRYQQQYDPTAYFLTAWLPSPNEVRQKGNPADLTRHPEEMVNITLEVMLQAAAQAMLNNDYGRAHVILDSITRVLDNQGVLIDPLATSYQNVILKLDSLGFDTHRVELNGDQATAWATARNSNTLLVKDMYLSGQKWLVTN